MANWGLKINRYGELSYSSMDTDSDTESQSTLPAGPETRSWRAKHAVIATVFVNLDNLINVFIHSLLYHVSQTLESILVWPLLDVLDDESQQKPFYWGVSVWKHYKFLGLLDLVFLLLGAGTRTGAAGSNHTNLLSRHSGACAGGRMSNVLVISTTVRVLHRVHGNTTSLWPRVPLDAVLVEGTASLEQRLVNTTTASNNADGCTAFLLEPLLGAGWKANLHNIHCQSTDRFAKSWLSQYIIDT